ncbi:MAG: helix-turn-helix domain-containing protein [Acidobacteria bacterium]|nr:helix-turn-helix domain-containing protein [Acidobacteriota bacterium]
MRTNAKGVQVATLKPLLDIEEVARIVGLPVATIYKQRQRRVGVGALGFRTGKHLRWDPNAIQAWIDEQSAKARDEAIE